jgi:transcription elongation factor SPT5
MNPALAMQTPGGGNPNMPPPRQGGRDRLIGKTVAVRKGRYKGLVGIVRDSDDKTATVELYTANKPVLLPREILVPKEYVILVRC